ncbi:hypothetical protein [Pseudescherichia sp.]|uniref:hypothetical protein n=1 Tax=Pseudescherichia sp. TaxID=2055881 RepID=UPI0028A05F6D|nr:hypothetical protein [Pseudescherichia sp.]
MADISNTEDIADRIVNIIDSPNTIKGMINGALTVPLDFAYLALGYFDTDSRYDHQTQRIRMLAAIRHDILNYDHIVDAIEIIFKEFNKYLSKEKQDDTYRGVITAITGRILATKIAVTTAAAIIERTAFIAAAESKTIIGKVAFTLLIGGMSERSIRKSESLQHEDPEIYSLLRPHDYDLTYFLFEPAVKPFVDAIHVSITQGKPAFDEIISVVGKKLHVLH